MSLLLLYASQLRCRHFNGSKTEIILARDNVNGSARWLTSCLQVRLPVGHQTDKQTNKQVSEDLRLAAAFSGSFSSCEPACSDQELCADLLFGVVVVINLHSHLLLLLLLVLQNSKLAQCAVNASSPEATCLPEAASG